MITTYGRGTMATAGQTRSLRPARSANSGNTSHFASEAVDRESGAQLVPPSLLLAALRVKQWTKNLLLFAGLLFAAKLGEAGRWGDAWLAFTAYAAASSAAYLLNDVRDVELDRLHPTKRRRPVASGRLSVRAAIGMSACLCAAALGTASSLGLVSLLLLVAFLALQIGYSLRLKTIAGLDVLAIAALFAIRAVAGAEAISVRISPWLVVCTVLLALLLALGKRRAELDRVGASARRVLVRYSLPILDRLLVGTSLATLGTYSAYAVTARDSLEMVATIPFVAGGVGRYFVLIHRHGLGEEPDDILLKDRPILLSAAGWIVTAAVLLTLN